MCLYPCFKAQRQACSVSPSGSARYTPSPSMGMWPQSLRGSRESDAMLDMLENEQLSEA